MHQRKVFDGPTAPKQCQRMVDEEGSPIQAQCKSRVFKAGLCTDHWRDMRIARATRQTPEPGVHCNIYKCFKTAVLMMDGTPWCIQHYHQHMRHALKKNPVDSTIETEETINA